MLFICLTEAIEEKKSLNNKGGFLYYMKLSYHKKCKTSFPFLIGNFCTGLLPHQLTFKFVHLSSVFTTSKMQFLPFFLDSNIAQRAKEIV